MTILDQLINLMLKKVEVTPVPKQELDDFLSQNNIDICNEHYQFLLKYGNSGFLKSDFGDLSFLEFKDYYLDSEILDDMKLPNGYNYIGMDFYENSLCKDPNESQLYSFGYGELNIPFDYNGLKELLFCSLFFHINCDEYFEYYENNIKINDINEFKEKYFKYEIKYIDTHVIYFFKGNKLIITNNNFYCHNLYQGGILDKVIDDR